MGGRFNILCLSGGGYLGLYGIAVLAELEKRCGRPIARSFDLLAGTSVGGIVALGLAHEIPAARILEAFERHGTAVFSNRPAPLSALAALCDVARFLGKAKYAATPLRQVIANLVGDDTRLQDLRHRVLIPTVNLTQGSAPQLFVTPHRADVMAGRDVSVVDVAMATSAVPAYFPVAQIGEACYADGGLFANTPDLLALHEAEHFLRVPDKNLYVMSIGTTTARFTFTPRDANLGLLAWGREQRLLKLLIAAQQQSVVDMMAQRLADRYLRIDCEQPRAQQRQLAFDVATATVREAMRGFAASTLRDLDADARLAAFLGHSAPAPAFV